MPDTGKDDSDSIETVTLPSRREILSGVGAGLAVGLAGCTGNGGGDGGGDGGGGDGGGGDGGDGGDDSTPTLTEAMEDEETLVWKNPHGNFEKQLNYNVWNPKTAGGNMSQGTLGAKDPRRIEFVSQNLGGPFVDWEVSRGEEVVFNLADLKWHDGETYTAEDVALHYRLLKQVFGEDAGPWKYADQVMARDDTTLAFNLTTDAVWEVIRDPFFNPAEDVAATRKSVHQEHYEALTGASTDSAKQEAKNNLLEMTINVEDVLGDGPPTGFLPWKPVEVKSNYIVNELWEDHPYADDINFSRVYGVNLNLMKKQGIQMIESGDLDSTKLALSQETAQKWRDDPDIKVRDAFKFQTTTLLMNNSHDLLSKTKVRRGLAYMIDRELVARQMFAPKPAPKPYPVPYSRSFIDQFAGDIKGDLFRYGTDREKGARLLEEAGLSKQGGQWIRPDGKPTNFLFVSAPAVVLDRGASAISQQFKRLGIGHKFVDKPGSYMWSKGYPNGGYDLVVGPWAQGFHPVQGMSICFDNASPPTIELPEEITYPSEIGNMDSEMKSVKPMEMVSKIPSMEEADRKAAIEELTWAYNSQVFSYGLSQKHMHHTWRVDDWKIPSKDTPGMGQGHASKWAAKAGLIQAKE